MMEKDFVELAKSLEEKAKAKGTEKILPSDAACGDEFPAGSKEVGFRMMSADAVPDGWLGLNNGSNATNEIKIALADNETII